MILTKFVRFQLTVFTILTVVALVVMGVFYMRLPALVGVGKYTVTVELTTTGGLYRTSNVTYRGATIGIVDSVELTDTGVAAVLSVDSSTKIPADAVAEVHSRSAIGEQYLDLIPTSTEGPYLEDGDVIAQDRTSVPQDIAPTIDTVNKSLQAIPQEQLTTLIDESYNAFEGIGPKLRQLIDSSKNLLTDARGNIDPTIRLIDDLGPFLDSQVVSSDAIRTWAANLADLSAQAKASDPAIVDIVDKAPSATAELTGAFQELRPTLPVLLANLSSLGEVALTYNASIEQILVVLPQGLSALQTIGVPNQGGTDRGFLSFNLSTLNNPAPCTTGFLPASERRDGSAVDSPTRTTDPIYCAIPQDAQNAVRGARNLPCQDKPGKRAPTVEMCKSDEEYVPLGTNPWIGNPTPTTDNAEAGQANSSFVPPPVPDPTSQTLPTYTTAQQPVATATYDPATGMYVAPDGNTYTQSELTERSMPNSGGVIETWQTMLTGQN